MFCTKCGQQLPEGCKFCTRCGAPTEKAGTERSKISESVIGKITPKQQNSEPVVSSITEQSAVTQKNESTKESTELVQVKTDSLSETVGSTHGIGKIIVAVIVVLGLGMAGIYYAQPDFIQHIPFLAKEKTESTSKSDRSIPAAERQIKQETAKKPAETNSATPTVQKGTAEYAFRAYHKAITAHQLREAYQYFSPDFRQNMGDYESWSAGYATTVASVPEKVSVLSSSDNRTVLSFQLKATDQSNGQEETNYFVGECTMVKLGGDWKIDEIAARKAD